MPVGGAGEATSGPPGGLTARPSGAVSRPLDPGVHRVEIGGRTAGLLSVPPHRTDVPSRFLVIFHGAGGDPNKSIGLLAGNEMTSDLVVLAPQSLGATWDFVVDDRGGDAAVLDAALAWSFERVSIDPLSVAAGGFSDGASYGLSIGLANGDLFSRLVGFSPGFVAPATPCGAPRLFVSHGTRDTVLPLDRCGRRVVASLRATGYDVEYDEFDGGHVVPPEVLHRAATWLGQGP